MYRDFDSLLAICVMAFAVSLGCGTDKVVTTVGEADATDTRQSRLAVPSETAAERSERIDLPHVQRRADQWEQLLDPARDGWKSEEFAEAARKQLVKLFARLAKPSSSSAAFSESDAIGRGLRSELELAFEQPGLRVQRGSNAADARDLSEHLDVGLHRLLKPLKQLGSPEFHFKVVRADIESDLPLTVVLYEALAVSDEAAIQQTARLTCRWNVDNDPPKLQSIECAEFEEVRVEAEHGRWFDDCTATVMAGQAAYVEQLLYGLNHWSQRVERAHQMDDTVRNGLAVGDANGDGLDDVYVCQGPGLPNRLFIQNRDGTVTDRAREANVDWLDQTSSALWIDLDNDSDQDLAIATFGGLLIMDNTGGGKFKLRARAGSRSCDSQSLSAVDYDNDGDLDLFLCVYRPEHVGRRGDFVFHNATTGGQNHLFRNDIKAGNWVFQDVTKEVGLGAGANRYSLAAAWEDYDADGDQDLYVANDYGPNNLFRNDSGHFLNATADAGLADTGFGMSVSWGDVNRDGQMDLYIGNMYSSAGNRVTQQAAFQQNATQRQRALYQRMAQGNSLFLQQPPGLFENISQAAGVRMGRWAWASVFADLNNDGWEDLLVANGYITTEDSGDL